MHKLAPKFFKFLRNHILGTKAWQSDIKEVEEKIKKNLPISEKKHWQLTGMVTWES